jgi:hypothetical protein
MQVYAILALLTVVWRSEKYLFDKRENVIGQTEIPDSYSSDSCLLNDQWKSSAT